MIAGYTYRAENYCSGHVISAMAQTYPVATSDAERHLDLLATVGVKVNRDDENTFDSFDFPKAITDWMVCQDGHDVCGVCGADLGGREGEG